MLRTAIAGFIGVLVGGVLMSHVPVGQDQATVAKVVRAERFEVVDSEGRLRMTLETADNTPMLGLRDENNQGRAALAILPDGSPYLVLLSNDEKGTAVLAVTPEGFPALKLTEADGDQVCINVP